MCVVPQLQGPARKGGHWQRALHTLKVAFLGGGAVLLLAADISVVFPQIQMGHALPQTSAAFEGVES